MRWRRRRPRDVSALRREGDITGLQAAARDYSAIRDSGRWIDTGAETRRRAVTALAEFYGPFVVETLVEALDDRDPRVRTDAVTGLRKQGSAAPPEPLIRALARSDHERLRPFRSEVLATLTSMHAERLPEAFTRALLELERDPLGDDDLLALRALLGADRRGNAARVEVVAIAVEGLGAVSAQHARAEQILEWFPEPAVARMIELLQMGREAPSLIRVLGASAALPAVEPLVGLLRSDSIEIRTAAAMSLGEIKDTRAVEPLFAATQDTELAVREAALRALDGMGTAAVAVGVARLIGPTLAALGTDSQSALRPGTNDPTD